ncbi:MAG: DUF523 domain-containing protein [Candidatus Tantalella remota]|nr:DUF523 domain-containing protein [Candidatus Tantalella remota]
MSDVKAKLLVSSCLIGKKCAYDGTSRLSEPVVELCSRVDYIDVCPEVEGGCACPRDRNEISGGTGADVLDGESAVVSSGGRDNTEKFLKGAQRALEAARNVSVTIAVLKSRSPSCGKYSIHAGKYDGTLRKGAGVTAELFLRNGITVFNEDETEQAARILT